MAKKKPNPLIPPEVQPDDVGAVLECAVAVPPLAAPGVEEQVSAA